MKTRAERESRIRMKGKDHSKKKGENRKKSDKESVSACWF